MHNSKVALALALTVVAAPHLHAQEASIAEYSAAQRVMIDDELAKARVKAQPAPQAPSAPAPASSPLMAYRHVEIHVEPAVALAGVSIIRNHTIAELSVNGTAYMLEVGDVVPGTTQVLTFADAKRVQLTKTTKAGRGKAAKPVVTTLELVGARR